MGVLVLSPNLCRPQPSLTGVFQHMSSAATLGIPSLRACRRLGSGPACETVSVHLLLKVWIFLETVITRGRVAAFWTPFKGGAPHSSSWLHVGSLTLFCALCGAVLFLLLCWSHSPTTIVWVQTWSPMCPWLLPCSPLWISGPRYACLVFHASYLFLDISSYIWPVIAVSGDGRSWGLNFTMLSGSLYCFVLSAECFYSEINKALFKSPYARGNNPMSIKRWYIYVM